MAPVKGLIRPRSIINVSPTAMWAIWGFPFLYQGVMVTRIIPAKTGIKAVTEGLSEERYAQLPRAINTIALRKFIKYGFIMLVSNLTVNTRLGSISTKIFLPDYLYQPDPVIYY